MKRPNYNIALNGENITTRHAWNTARRSIARIIQARLDDKETAALTHQTYFKTEDGTSFTHGIEQWTGSSGRIFNILIEREADNA